MLNTNVLYTPIMSLDSRVSLQEFFLSDLSFFIIRSFHLNSDAVNS